MRTKRYTIIIAGLMPEIVTQSILIKIWEKSCQRGMCGYRYICKRMAK